MATPRKFLFTLIFAVAMISAAMAQRSSDEKNAAVKEAITYAENVAFVLADKVQNENFTYIFLTGYGSVYREYNDPIFKSAKAWQPLQKENALGAKAYFLGVLRKGGAVKGYTTGGVALELDTLTFNFEPGKYYTVDSRGDNDLVTDFSIKETDITPYLAYQTANPNRLNGTWNGEGKRLLTTFLNQYHFDGNRMRFEGESKNPKQTFVVEGKVMYNENTIIFFPERADHKGKEVKNFNSRADRAVYIWYYTLIDNELHIEVGNPFFIGTQSWVNTGNFQKNN